MLQQRGLSLCAGDGWERRLGLVLRATALHGRIDEDGGKRHHCKCNNEDRGAIEHIAGGADDGVSKGLACKYHNDEQNDCNQAAQAASAAGATTFAFTVRWRLLTCEHA